VRLAQILAEIVETNHPFTMPIPHKDGFCGIKYSKIVAAEVRTHLRTPLEGDTDADFSSRC